MVDELVGSTSSPIATAELASKGPALLEAQSYALQVMGTINANHAKRKKMRQRRLARCSAKVANAKRSKVSRSHAVL